MRFNVELKEELHKELMDMASKDGRTASDVVRELVIKWISRRTSERLEQEKFKRIANDREQ